MYLAVIEKRSSTRFPWVFKCVEWSGEINDGNPEDISLGNGELTLEVVQPCSIKLALRGDYRVVLEAERHRERIEVLSSEQPEFRTQRSRVTVYPLTDAERRLILFDPAFPLGRLA